MDKKLYELCVKVKKEIKKGNDKEAYRDITDAMKNYPDSGVPNNLYGILEEYRLHHFSAMKHFRAAWALDPTFLPARWNMDVYGSGKQAEKCAFLEEDVPRREQEGCQYKCVYDERGIGHMVRR